MVDLQLIQNNQNTGLFHTFITGTVETERFIVEKNARNIYSLKDKSKTYGNVYNEDDMRFLNFFYRKIIESTFDSILISGLGIGILPYICQNTTTNVDVVEIDQDVINFVSELSHLKNNVSIFNSDIDNFVPQKEYDIIVLDHWSLSATEYEKNYFTNKFTPFLSSNGFLTIPIIEQFRK